MSRLLLALAALRSNAFAEPDRITQIAPGVWMREGDLAGKGHCNNAVSERKDYLIVVDANFPSGAHLLRKALPALSTKPVRYVLLTHHHGDHAYGSAVWTRAGAITVAHQAETGEMSRFEPKRWLASREARADVRELQLMENEPPRETFSDSPRVFSDGTRRVEFWHFGWGHTAGDAVVYLPAERILVTGDLAVNGPYNFTADSHLENWPRMIRTIQSKLPADHVLPGHGVAGGSEILQGQAEFLESLLSSVKDAVAQGKSLDDLVEMDGAVPAKAKLLVPGAKSPWGGWRLPLQIRDAYLEVTSNAPVGSLPH